MKKTTITLLLAMVCCYATIQGQDLAKWGLTNNSVASYQSTHVNAGKLTRGNGISPINFTPNGAFAHAWESSTDISAADYYEICIQPKPGYLLDISSLAFTETRTAEGIRAYRLKWSLDGFKTFTILDDVAVPDDVNSRTAAHSNLNIRICDGKTLCIRWYGREAEAYTGEWYLSNVIIKGSEMAACNPPAIPPTNLALSNITGSSMDVSWTPGGTNATLVLAREGSPVDATLCGGTPFTTDPVFGQGSKVGKETFVVFNGTGTSFTLDGLKAGAVYYLTALGYNTAGNCLQNSNLPVVSGTTLCSKPVAVEKLLISPADGQMSLAWEAPSCYDEVMVVASSQPIASLPTNANATVYTTNSVFSPGGGVGEGFTPDEALVYRGTGDKITITGLNNGQGYYFRIYTFRNGTWTAGTEVAKKPVAGCAFLGGDFIYLNELHFHNKNMDIDVGIEVAGLAGIDLENYLLAIYTNQSNLDRIIELSGTIPNEFQGYGAFWVPDPELPKHCAIALVNRVTGVTTDFVSHRVGAGLVANDGPAAGQPAFWQGRNEDTNTPANYSIQRQGDIACPNTSQAWVGPVLASRGQLNLSQSAFPITLLSFTGKLHEERVLLSWQTETEKNNDYMAVEFSPDGRKFQEIGQVKGAGTTTEPQAYRLWHDHPLPGLNYYRLRQVDFDGKLAYHGPIAIEYNGKGTGMLLYPNLATTQISVEIARPAEHSGELFLYDINGRPLQRLATAPGFIRQELDVTALPSGYYFLHWRSDKGELLKERFVKL